MINGLTSEVPTYNRHSYPITMLTMYATGIPWDVKGIIILIFWWVIKLIIFFVFQSPTCPNSLLIIFLYYCLVQQVESGIHIKWFLKLDGPLKISVMSHESNEWHEKWAHFSPLKIKRFVETLWYSKTRVKEITYVRILWWHGRS